MVSSLPTLSQIRNYNGQERPGKEDRSQEISQKLRQGLKEYRKEKSPEAKAKLNSIWSMASHQGINIDKKLNEEVKKVLREPDLSPASGASGAQTGAPAAGAGAGDEGANMGDLVGGLAQNFGGAAGAGPTSETPAAEASAPAVEASAPAAEASAPAVEASAPAAEASAPAVEASAPAAEASAPAAEASAPEVEASAPAAEASAPPVEASAPAAEASAPEVEASAPAAEGAASAVPDPKTENASEATPGTEAAAEAGKLQATPEVKPSENQQPAPANDPFADTRSALTQSFRDSKVLDEQSMNRLGNMMKGFEDRMAGLAMTQIDAYRRAHGSITPEKAQEILAQNRQKVEDTYRHLAELVGTKQGSAELFNQADRTSMSENLLFHLADPRTFDQGSNGTCWINSSTASYGLSYQPDDMARFMKEISLTGQFRAHPDGTGNGERTIQFHKGQFYATGEERNWKISNALNGSARSPVGMFMDEAMTEMVGKHRADAGSYHGSWGAKRIMTMISGEAPPEPRGRLGNARVNRQMGQGDLQTMLEYGGFQTYSPGHLQSVQFVPEGKTAWDGKDGLTYDGQKLKLDGSDRYSGYIVLDNQWGERSDYVTHYVKDGQIQDIQDQRYQHFDPGKVTNERQITIRPGNDSNGGGGWGGGGGWDGGGLVPMLPSVLDQILKGGGQADPKDITQAGGWTSMMKSLTQLAEKEVASGKLGKNYQMLKKVMRKTGVAQVVDPGTLKRMKQVMAKGRVLEVMGTRPKVAPPVRR